MWREGLLGNLATLVELMKQAFDGQAETSSKEIIMNRTALSIVIAALFSLVGFAHADEDASTTVKNHYAKSIMELDPASVFPTQGPADGGGE